MAEKQSALSIKVSACIYLFFSYNGTTLVKSQSVPPPRYHRRMRRRTSLSYTELKRNLVDIYSDPRNPQTITFEDVAAAHFLIKNSITKTSLTVRGRQ